MQVISKNFQIPIATLIHKRYDSFESPELWHCNFQQTLIEKSWRLPMKCFSNIYIFLLVFLFVGDINVIFLRIQSIWKRNNKQIEDTWIYSSKCKLTSGHFDVLSEPKHVRVIHNSNISQKKIIPVYSKMTYYNSFDSLQQYSTSSLGIEGACILWIFCKNCNLIWRTNQSIC